jgi:nitroimidazol reductase NimA-like FMN-containing flavoprotein (pyridoxamine 5'-phosphate oxidase superfamily)
MESLGNRSSTVLPPGALTALDRDACLALLAGRPVGRLVFTHRALPDVIPVNYQLDGENLVIRLSSGSAAASATRDAVVAFEVDEIDFAARTGWSVTVVGRAHEITDSDERQRVQGLGLMAWVADVRDHYVAVAVEKVTGRRLLPASNSAPLDRAADAIGT